MQKISPICVANLLKLAKTYAATQCMSIVTVGRYFHGTGPIFERLERGEAQISLKTYDDMMARFRKRWPKDVPWPKIREPFRAAGSKGGLRERRRVRKARAPQGADLPGER